MPKTDVPPNFAELIAHAQKLPESDANLGTDASSPFPLPLPDGQRVVNLDDEKKIPGVPEIPMKAHVKVFMLPQNIGEYETVLNEMLNAEAVLRYEERHFTKEGDCIIVLCYLTYKKPPTKKDPDEDEAENERYRQ